MKEKILKQVKDSKVKFIKLQFTDILGVMKNINITADQLEKALDNEIMFDGSSIDGFARIEESDMFLYPDLETFLILPTKLSGDVVEARIICDVYNANREPFNGDPRYILKKVVNEVASMGYEINVGPEMEFFMFKLDEQGNPTLNPSDQANYFDLSTTDKAHVVKREMCLILQEMGFEVEAAHHENAPGQHEIAFRYQSALKSADNIMTFKATVKQVAEAHGLYATFMPKPVFGLAGSGMHMNQSLFKDGKNAFYDEKDAIGLSKEAYHYVAGILKHAKGTSLLTNSNINSYKRLVSGYEAPINICWATKNRSPLIRVPASRGNGTRIELRNPDPSCNPYLAFAGVIAAGLDGIKNELIPPTRIEGNTYEFTKEEAKDIEVLPENLKMALNYMLRDELIKETLGEHVVNCLTNATNEEWDNYRKIVTPYETDKYIYL